MTQEEKAILSYFVEKMECKGYTRQTVLVSFTDEVIDEINIKYSTPISEETIDMYINKLVASEHLTHRCLSGCKNSNMQVTSKGVAVITSLRVKEEQLKNRTLLKKVSDFIDEHKGVLTLTAILLALASFVLRLKGLI